jgi:glucose-1-phosphate cytidylyltransferase
MKVVLLCGGQGTRIRDVSESIPKPMLPIADKPILWHIMKYFGIWGHKEFILCLGYKSQVIKDFFINYDLNARDFTISLDNKKAVEYQTMHSETDWRVSLIETGVGALTGARIKRIQKYVSNDEYFMLTYGDGVGDIDIDRLIEFHISHGRILTVTGVRPPSRFGELRCTESGKVTEFNEKPQASGGRISGGYFVCRREIFNYLNDQEDLIFETEPMKKLVEDQQLMMYPHDGFWEPMDTYRDYLYLNKLAASKEAPWIKW